MFNDFQRHIKKNKNKHKKITSNKNKNRKPTKPETKAHNIWEKS